jgi:ribosomal-protein-alanine N-acetyltransferase
MLSGEADRLGIELRSREACVIAGQKCEVRRETRRVAIRRLTAADRQEFIELVKGSSSLLYPWVVLPSTEKEFDEYLQRFDGIAAECLLVCDRATDAIVGVISISDIRRGPYQRATVGYNAFEPYAGQGYMTDGMHLVLRFVFEDLGLHRIEADIQPENVASQKLARKAGFRQEGYSPELICIHGVWRDHERWAITGNTGETLRSALSG